MSTGERRPGDPLAETTPSQVAASSRDPNVTEQRFASTENSPFFFTKQENFLANFKQLNLKKVKDRTEPRFSCTSADWLRIFYAKHCKKIIGSDWNIKRGGYLDLLTFVGAS